MLHLVEPQAEGVRKTSEQGSQFGIRKLFDKEKPLTNQVLFHNYCESHCL